MNWHAQLHRPDTINSEGNSLHVAFANLLMKFDRDADPAVIASGLSTEGEVPPTFSSITTFEPAVLPSAIGTEGWPETTEAVVRFRYIRPSDGETIDHYCLIANPVNRTIVDSLDGKVKHPGMYGEPTGWAEYRLEALEEPDTGTELEQPESLPDVLVHRTGFKYVVKPDDTVWSISRAYKAHAPTLLAHNELSGPEDLKVGSTIFIPPLYEIQEGRDVTYELLTTPREMHVTPEEGVQKFSFGGVKSWSDIRPTGQRYREGHNVRIVAIAHVPLGDETAAYFMDEVALGDYVTTGRVRYNIGYSWQHLEDGHITKEALAEKKENARLQAIEEALEAEKAKVEVKVEEKVETPAATNFRNTFEPYADGPVIYYAYDTMKITDHGGQLEDRLLHSGQQVEVIGEYEHDGIRYGRPKQAAKMGAWYGVPMDNLYVEDELFTTEVDLPTKVVMHHSLSLAEHGVVYLSRAISTYTRFKTVLDKRKAKRSNP